MNLASDTLPRAQVVTGWSGRTVSLLGKPRVSVCKACWGSVGREQRGGRVEVWGEEGPLMESGPASNRLGVQRR